MWEMREGGQFRFRCHTGHGFTPESLLAEQSDRLENALWTAVRVLQERSALHRKLAESCEGRGMTATSQRYLERADEESRKANILREFLNLGQGPATIPLGEAE